MKSINLWGDDFDEVSSKNRDEFLIDSISKPIKVVDSEVDDNKKLKSKKVPIEDKLVIIKNKVLKKLGKHKEDTLVITDRKVFSDYIDKAIESGIIAVDTETNNSLDPLTCKLMGLCLYVPDEKQVYVPINHVDINTRERLTNQLTEDDCREELQRLLDNNVKMIYHNGKFDYKVIHYTCNIDLTVDWDTMIGARLINENVESASLKYLYVNLINREQEKYSIEELFENIEYAIVDYNLFALYAATDSRMTYDLYMWQLNEFNKKGNERLFNLFRDVEMPVLTVVAKMEMNGISLDLEYSERLRVKYETKFNELTQQFNEQLKTVQDKIDIWKQSKEATYKPQKKNNKGEVTYGKSKLEQLEDPINLDSPTQLAILLYDILKLKPVDEENPRSTDKNTLPILAKENDLSFLNTLLKRKEVDTLLNNFINKLPKLVNIDGKIHCNFNQLGKEEKGVVTGRFSSSDPNLQQIPSHNKEIRMMFCASKGNTLLGSDYSQQEPRTLSFYSRDENMINAYREGKDLYASVAARVYKKDYYDCLEQYPDGTPNPDGKNRRASMKPVILGLMYSRGAAAIAEQIGSTKEEAQSIIDDFYNSFPKVKEWIKNTEEFALKYGYVEDWYGRIRHLPILLEDDYSFTLDDKDTFNPILFSRNKQIDEKLLSKYKQKVKSIRGYKDFYKLQEEAKGEGVLISSCTELKAKAKRQSVNARIQGGAATITKIAMIKLDRDEELNKLGFKLLIGVHDELIGECPKENSEQAAERLTYVMKTAVQEWIDVPFKCDADVCEHWYYNDYCGNLVKEYKGYLKDNSKEIAFNKIVDNHSEISIDELRNIVESE